VQNALAWGTDGLNFDIEGSTNEDGLTKLMQIVSTVYRGKFPHAQISMDTGAYPIGLYDYVNLAKYVGKYVYIVVLIVEISFS
jgi:hypothetical protein